MKNNQRVFYIDLIRAISVLMIITYHFNQNLGDHRITSSEIFKQTFASENIGSLGITLFIIISGASLMASYGPSLEFRSFLKKRFLAIFPIYWTGYAVTAAALFLLHGHINAIAPHSRFLLTLIGMDGFLYYRLPNFYLLGEWFLGFILIMYAAFPLIRKLALNQPRLLVALVAVLYFAVVTFYPRLFIIDIVHNPLTRLPEFVSGVLFVWYAPRLPLYVLPAALALLAVPLIWHLDIAHIYVALITGVGAFCTLVIIAERIHFGERATRVVSFVSKYSFAAFLVHHNIMGELLMRFFHSTLSRTEVYLLYTIVVVISFAIGVQVTKATEAVTNFLGWTARKKVSPATA